MELITFIQLVFVWTLYLYVIMRNANAIWETYGGILFMCNNENSNAICEMYVFILRLLTHVGLFRQNCLIFSEVVLCMERSKNHEKNYIITVQKNFTFLRMFDCKNTVFAISRNLIEKLIFK